MASPLMIPAAERYAPRRVAVLAGSPLAATGETERFAAAVAERWERAAAGFEEILERLQPELIGSVRANRLSASLPKVREFADEEAGVWGESARVREHEYGRGAAQPAHPARHRFEASVEESPARGVRMSPVASAARGLGEPLNPDELQPDSQPTSHASTPSHGDPLHDPHDHYDNEMQPPRELRASLFPAANGPGRPLASNVPRQPEDEFRPFGGDLVDQGRHRAPTRAPTRQWRRRALRQWKGTGF